tara:strand:+ start:9863 stop:12391 length:2529 start_codon:yes stop_codon:yes gene_type:complete
MGRAPRYERMGVRVRQPRGTRFAAQAEAVQYQEAVSQALGTMSDFLFEKGAEVAEQRGLERVKQEGAIPILEELQQQGGPRTIEEKTAYEAANKLAVAEIQTEAELDITKVLDEGQANKTSYNAIQSKLSDITDGYSSALSSIDPISAGLLRQRLIEATGKADMRYAKWWSGEQETIRREKQNVVAGNKAQTILQNATMPGATTLMIDAEIAASADTLKDLGVDEKALQDWQDEVKASAYKNNYLFSFNQLSVEEQGEAIERILGGEAKDLLPGMDYEDSVRFVNGILRPEYNRNVSILGSQSKYVVNKVSDLNKILESGGRVSQDDIQELRSRAIEVEQYDGGVSVQAVNELEGDTNIYSGFRAMSLAEMEATVRLYAEGIEGVGIEGRDTPLEVKRYEQASKFFEKMQTQINQDAMGYAERVGFIERKQIVSIDEQGALQLDDVALSERALQAQQVADYYGLPQPKMLFADETRQLALVLERAEGAAKLNLLGTLSSFDQASGQVLTDLADYNPNLALVGALVNAGATEAAKDAVAGLDRLDAGEKPIEFTPLNIDAVYSDLFERAVTQPRQAQAIKGVAKAIYIERASRLGVDQFDPDLYEKALQLASGQRVINGIEYGGIQEVRGVKTFINPNLDAGSYERMLNELTPEALSSVTGLDINPKLASSINEDNNYKLRNIGGDKYVIEYPGQSGLVNVGDTEGRPVIFDSQELFEALIPQPQASQGTGSLRSIFGTDELPENIEQPDVQFEEAIAPEVPTESPPLLTAGQLPDRRLNKKQTKFLRKQVEAAKIPASEYETRIKPLADKVPNEATNDEFVDYLDALFKGFNKSFEDWKATQ